MLRRSFGFFVAGLSLACAVRAASAQDPAPAAQAGPAPHVAFDSKDANLGEVQRGEDAVATFTYRNTGNAPLHILSAKPG